LCHGDQLFPASASATSLTFATTIKKIQWSNDKREAYLVDTPGLGDSEGRDGEHIANMVAEIKKIGFINTFLIVFNGQNPRFDQHLKSMLSLFKEIFGPDFIHNTAFLFTRWS
jgi:predicted GTPase